MCDGGCRILAFPAHFRPVFADDFGVFFVFLKNIFKLNMLSYSEK